MSCCAYIYKLEKSTYEEIKDLDYIQLKIKYGDDENYFYFRNIHQKQLYSFGEFDNKINEIRKLLKPLFLNEKTMTCLKEDDIEPYILNQQGIDYLINWMKTKIVENFKELKSKGLVYKNLYFENRINAWENDFIYKKTKKGKYITDSIYYEYEIFKLIDLANNIDWNNDIILFYEH